MFVDLLAEIAEIGNSIKEETYNTDYYYGSREKMLTATNARLGRLRFAYRELRDATTDEQKIKILRSLTNATVNNYPVTGIHRNKIELLIGAFDGRMKNWTNWKINEKGRLVFIETESQKSQSRMK